MQYASESSRRAPRHEPPIAAFTSGALIDRSGLLDDADLLLAALDSSRAAILLEPARKEEEPASVGRYRVVRRLARRGMGIVYLAHDPRLGRLVALKLLPPYLDAAPAAVRRLGGEAS